MNRTTTERSESKKSNGEVSMMTGRAKDAKSGSLAPKIMRVLIFTLMLGSILWLGWHQPGPAEAGLMHNATETNSTLWGGNWGLSGGKYGQFTCETCHTRTTTNIKRIKTSIATPDSTSWGSSGASTVSPVTFLNPATDMGDDLNHTTSTKVCQVCHSATTTNKYNQNPAVPHNGTTDCTQCHQHNKGFKGPVCLDCHDVQRGNRAPIVGQFASNSHHVQGTTITNAHCYNCHWEAQSNGKMNATYHTFVPDSPVDLVVWGTANPTATARPTNDILNTTRVAYTAVPSSRTEYAKINQHCLGCHNNTNLTTKPFTGDNYYTSRFAWDATSIDSRYSDAGTTAWGKYSSTTYTAVSPKDTQKKAYSAHGRADLNMRGWNTSETWPNTSGTTNVLCYDCHNAHGSSVGDGTYKAVSYPISTATVSGGILKDVTNGQGGFGVTYKPAAGGGAAGHNTYNPGAGLCFDCHETNTSGATSGKPWGYNDTFGATQAIRGYFDKPYWDGTSATDNGAQQRYPNTKGTRSVSGGHFGASSALGKSVSGTIGGLCSPCHDPHGVSTSLGANRQYGVPLLKGTWVTSPYKEDAAPLGTGRRGGRSSVSPPSSGAWKGVPGPFAAQIPGYHIDQNTFTSVNMTSWTQANPNAVSQTPQQFGGLCLNCHTAMQPSGTGIAWKNVDRIHRSVDTWADSTSKNANNQIHSYICAKCHTSHNTCLPRLAITNCLDFKHKNQVVAGNTGGRRWGLSRSGMGWGRFPSGGGGKGSGTSAYNSGRWFFGTAGTVTTTRPTMPDCHTTPASNGNPNGTASTDNSWNTKTQW